MEKHTPLIVYAMKKNDVTSLDEIRQSAKFLPTIWGDYFLDSDNTEISGAEHAELAKQKEMVRQSLAQTSDDSKLKMELIDAIQRLGLHYHFENEIEKSLQYIHENYKQFDGKDNGIHTVALRFRLLRQQGYNVPCDVFDNFIDNEGNFVESLKNDIEGLLSFYEAAHLGAHGEKILDNAIEFCSYHLRMNNNAHNLLSKRVDEALKMPIRKSLTRLGARKFITMYQEEESHDEILLNFAKFDFNMVQKLHQRELSDVTRWWKKFDIANKMTYTRDRIVELFLWVVGVYFEPQYTIARKILVKSISMASILDDTYEYATLNDLQILTEAIERWDVDTTLDDSPPHIQMCYKILIDTYVEIEDEMKSALDSYRIQYAKQEMKKLVRAYFEEAKWLFSDYIPTFEEYMKLSLVTCGYMMLSTTSLVGMGDLVGKEDFDWVTNEPLMVRASLVICRVMDDLVGDEYEHKPSSVYCFMKQYGVTKDEACEELREKVKNAWKDMNQECLEPRPTSMAVLMRVINLGRVINLLYAEEDGYSNPNKSKEWVKMVFVEPVKI